MQKSVKRKGESNKVCKLVFEERVQELVVDEIKKSNKEMQYKSACTLNISISFHTRYYEIFRILSSP